MISDLNIVCWFMKCYAVQAITVCLLLAVYSLVEMISIGALYPLLNHMLSGNGHALNSGGQVLFWIDSLLAYIPIQDKLIAASTFLLGIIIISNMLGLLSESVSLWFHLKLYADFQNKIYEKILKNNYLYFHEKKHGDLLYIGREASLAVGETFFYFPKVGVEFFRIILVSVLLLSMSVKLTLITYIFIAVFGLITYIISIKIVHPAAEKVLKANSELTSIFSESVSSIKQIKIFYSYEYWIRLFQKQTSRSRFVQLKSLIPTYVSNRLITALGVAFTIIAVIYVRVTMKENFAQVIPLVVVFIGAIMRLMPSISNLGHYWMGMKSLSPRLRVTYETLSDEQYRDGYEGVTYDGFKEAIELRNVSFSYPTKRDVLQGINIYIPRKSTIALVGESGSGKSTLADIITRLYEPESGEITVDGVNYEKYSKKTWLSHLAMVSQDTFIYHASIGDNIRIGKPDASVDELAEAARIANAQDFISELPEGYQTVVGDRGVKLSGGQRQRIAIARAVIRNPSLLILDEATSALDNISEKQVQNALQAVKQNKTTIIIAHRLSTIENADNIIVLEQGRVVEQGTHTDLLAQKSYYYNLYQRQKEMVEEKGC